MIIREARLEDAKGIAKVHVDSWLTTYKGIVPDEYLNGLTYKKREQLWLNNIPNGYVFVAENDNGQIVGFSSGGRERSGKYKDYEGELSAIYILKEYQGKGLGKRLVKPISERLEELGLRGVLVLVLEDNEAKYFYETLGAKLIDRVEIEISGKRLKELVYGWDDIKKAFLDYKKIKKQA